MMKNVYVLSLLALSGCAGILSNISAGTGINKLGAPTKKSVDEAKAKGDYAAVQDICQNEGSKASSDVANYACATGRAMKTDAFLQNEDCAKLPELFKDASFEGVDQYTAGAKKFAACGDYKSIFEDMAHIGEYGASSIGTTILIRLEESGSPMKAEFTSYLQSHQGSSFLNIKHQSYAADHIGLWLRKKSYTDLCAPLAASLTDASDELVANFLFYFEESRCKEGVPLAINLLASDTAGFRKTACKSLGALGDKSAISKMQIVAESDNYYEIVDENRIYYVRDTCNEAIGKLKLKGK